MATYLQRVGKNARYTTMVSFPKSGSRRAALYVSIKKKEKHGEGKHAGLAALAADPNIKMVVIDDDIDVFEEEQVWWAVAFRCEMEGLVLIPYALGPYLNPSACANDRTKRGIMKTRVLIDATWPLRSFEKVPKASGSRAMLSKITSGDYAKRTSPELLRRLRSLATQ